MTWFETLTGCPEVSPAQVRAALSIDGLRLYSHCNDRSWLYGELEIPTLAQLRQRVRPIPPKPETNSLREVVANVQQLHQDKANENSLFQVASQFNLLEMISPHFSPEQGVGIYERDFTQGPACAIAAGAGTIYRNYFAVVNGNIGQSADHQIDCLAGIGTLLGNTEQDLWRMTNGYVLPTASGLQEINQRLQVMDESGRDQLRQALQIGLQWHTQVTLGEASHVVSQIYCSALPVAYSPYQSQLWAPFATLILEAAYEATICAAILNAEQTGNNRLFLTLLGGGAFGNEQSWIIEAIHRALSLYPDYGLEIAIVSYGRSQPCVQKLIAEFTP